MVSRVDNKEAIASSTFPRASISSGSSGVQKTLALSSLLHQGPPDDDIGADLASQVARLQTITRASADAAKTPADFFGAADICPHKFETDDVQQINQMIGRYCFTNTMSFHDLFGLEMNRLLKDLSTDLDPEAGKTLIAEWKCLWMRGFLGLLRLSGKGIFPKESAATSQQFLFPDVYGEQLKTFTLSLRNALLNQHQKKKDAVLQKKNGAQKAQALDEHFKERTNLLFNEFNAVQRMLAKRFLPHPQKVLLLIDSTLNTFPGTLAMQPASQEEALAALTQLYEYVELMQSAATAANQQELIPMSPYLDTISKQINSLIATHDISELAPLCRFVMKSLKKNIPQARELLVPLDNQMNQYKQIESMQSAMPQASFILWASSAQIEKTTSDFLFHTLTSGWANDCTHSLISILEQLDGTSPVYNHTKRFVLNLKAIVQTEYQPPQMKTELLKNVILGLYRNYRELLDSEDGVGKKLLEICQSVVKGDFNLFDTYMDHREDLFQKLKKFIEHASSQFSLLAKEYPELCEQENLLMATPWFARLCILRYDLEQMAHPYDCRSENGDLFPEGYIDLLLLDPSFKKSIPAPQPGEEDGDLPTPAAAAAPAKKKRKKKKNKDVAILPPSAPPLDAAVVHSKELPSSATIAAGQSVSAIPSPPVTAAHNDPAPTPPIFEVSATADHPDYSAGPLAADVSVTAHTDLNDAPLPIKASARTVASLSSAPPPSALRSAFPSASHGVHSRPAAAQDAASSFDIAPPKSRKRQDIADWVKGELDLTPLPRKQRGKGDHKIYSNFAGITLSVPDHKVLKEGTYHAIRKQFIEQRKDIANKTAAAAATIMAPSKKKKK